jgi:heme-degrading monooxygenase HmoA
VITPTPDPPYVAVIFTTERTEHDDAGYQRADASLLELVAEQPGYLGVESVGDGDRGITVSYWETAEHARGWKQVAEHQVAQRLGRELWFRRYRVRVAAVEREYGFG